MYMGSFSKQKNVFHPTKLGVISPHLFRRCSTTLMTCTGMTQQARQGHGQLKPRIENGFVVCQNQQPSNKAAGKAAKVLLISNDWKGVRYFLCCAWLSGARLLVWVSLGWPLPSHSQGAARFLRRNNSSTIQHHPYADDVRLTDAWLQGPKTNRKNLPSLELTDMGGSQALIFKLIFTDLNWKSTEIYICFEYCIKTFLQDAPEHTQLATSMIFYIKSAVT